MFDDWFEIEKTPSPSFFHRWFKQHDDDPVRGLMDIVSPVVLVVTIIIDLYYL